MTAFGNLESILDGFTAVDPRVWARAILLEPPPSLFVSFRGKFLSGVKVIFRKPVVPVFNQLLRRSLKEESRTAIRPHFAFFESVRNALVHYVLGVILIEDQVTVLGVRPCGVGCQEWWRVQDE